MSELILCLIFIACITNTAERTTDVSVVYDPYDKRECVRFLAWLERTPCTLPLYIWRNGENLRISLSEKRPEGSVPYNIACIYVLSPYTSPPCKRSFSKMGLDPVFRFSNSFGKCIPDPDGEFSLERCVEKYNRMQPIGLLSYFENEYREKKNEQKSKNRIFYFFVICLAVVIMIILLKKLFV